MEQGILVAMVISLLRIVKHSYHPHRGVMILDANGTWRVVPVRDGLTTQPGLVIYHFGAALFMRTRAVSLMRCCAPSGRRHPKSNG